jgi:hypothetical protein
VLATVDHQQLGSNLDIVFGIFQDLNASFPGIELSPRIPMQPVPLVACVARLCGDIRTTAFTWHKKNDMLVND